MRRVAHYHNTETWRSFVNQMSIAMSLQQIQTLANDAYAQIRQGALPPIAANGIDREMSIALERLASHGGLLE